MFDRRIHYNFTIVQNDLFYFKNRVELWKKDINSLNREIIDDCFQFAIVGSEIYFSTNDFKHIYKTTVDGGQQLVYTVTKPYIITDMKVRGKYIYMTQIIPETGIDYIKCIRIHVETCEEEEVSPMALSLFRRDKNWFYYIDVVIKQIDDENGYFHLRMKISCTK